MSLDCVSFLQWALPRLNMRWAGFRKVRKLVCKRIRRRMKELQLSDYESYRDWLNTHEKEWEELDTLCRIPISRFYRDWAVFDAIKDEILPKLAQRAYGENRPVRIWSAGCASGEEPYTVSMIWKFIHRSNHPETGCEIIATDIDTHMLERARTGCYTFGSLKGLPDTWIEKAFDKKEQAYCIMPEFAANVELVQQDIRTEMPEGLFDLVLCRNLVAMYFDPQLQLVLFKRIIDRMRPGGFLVLGRHETLPAQLTGIKLWKEKLNTYVKPEDSTIG